MFESLENRQMFSTSVLDPRTHVLTVTADTNVASTMRILPNSNNKLDVAVNGQVIGTFLLADVGQIDMVGSTRNDTFFVDPTITKNTRMVGGIGDDIMTGGAGNDTMEGGAGNDLFDGAAGTDTVSYASTLVNIRATLDGIQNDGGLFVPVQVGSTFVRFSDVDNIFSTVENLIGSNFNDVMIGNGSNNNMNGLAGNDTLSGGNGNDKIAGGAGADLLTGSNGNDALAGEAGNDTLIGSNGDDSLAGGDDNDFLAGGAGRDSLFGDAGNDVIIAENGSGTTPLFIRGGAGTDIQIGNDPIDDVLEIELKLA